YSFGGDHAVQVWYRDTTLRMVRFHQTYKDRFVMPGVLQYQYLHQPQLVVLNPAAMRAVLEAETMLSRTSGPRVREMLLQADSLVPDPRAVVFHGTMLHIHALSLYLDGHTREALAEEQRVLAILPEKYDARYLLAYDAKQRGDLVDLRAQ